LIPTFARDLAAAGCKCRNRTTSGVAEAFVEKGHGSRGNVTRRQTRRTPAFTGAGSDNRDGSPQKATPFAEYSDEPSVGNILQHSIFRQIGETEPTKRRFQPQCEVDENQPCFDSHIQFTPTLFSNSQTEIPPRVGRRRLMQSWVVRSCGCFGSPASRNTMAHRRRPTEIRADLQDDILRMERHPWLYLRRKSAEILRSTQKLSFPSMQAFRERSLHRYMPEMPRFSCGNSNRKFQTGMSEPESYLVSQPIVSLAKADGNSTRRPRMRDFLRAATVFGMVD
jgi:hypothetical protein